MAGRGKYEISQTAYIKSVLHAIKHKTSAVNGILIGRVRSNVPENFDFSLDILDAVPLFHGQLGLLPMLELALMQVDEHLTMEGKGLQIVGYYHANERFDDRELNGVARKIGDHILRHCPQAIILLLDNEALRGLPQNTTRKPVQQLYLRDPARGWREADGDLVLKESTTNSLLFDYSLEGRDQLVVDFHDHLDDIKKDWLNEELFN